MNRRVLITSCLILVAGLVWSSVTFAQCPVRKNCQESVVISKKTFAEKPDCIEQYDCSTDPDRTCDDCIMRMQWTTEITGGPDCDESNDIIPNGSKIKIDSTYHIRTVGPCQTPVGTHVGKFKIVSPTGTLLAIGRIKGTNGLETHHSGADECCEPFHGEGLMEGRFIRSALGGRKCKKFVATYASSIDPTTAEDKVCDPEYWKNWQLDIAGIIMCKCTPTTEESN